LRQLSYPQRRLQPFVPLTCSTEASSEQVIRRGEEKLEQSWENDWSFKPSVTSSMHCADRKTWKGQVRGHQSAHATKMEIRLGRGASQAPTFNGHFIYELDFFFFPFKSLNVLRKKCATRLPDFVLPLGWLPSSSLERGHKQSRPTCGRFQVEWDQIYNSLSQLEISYQ